MSILTDVQVTILLADYAGADMGGKLNLVGGGIRFIGQQQDGTSSPFTVVVQIDLPEKYAGQEFSLTLEVVDVTLGKPVSLPGGPGGQPQPLRAQQVVQISPIQLQPGVAKPQDAYTSNNVIMNFANGLPLTPGHSFEARVQIDGQTRHWFYRFHVLGPAPGVVFGGPMNPPSIPGFGEYIVDPPQPPQAAGEEPPKT